MFYLTPDGMMAVDIKAGEPLVFGTPHQLFPVTLVVDGVDRPFDVGLNGQIVMFVMVVPLGDPPPPTVLLNWTARLKR